MSETTPNPAAAAPPAKNRRLVLIMLLIIAAGLVWGLFKVLLWNPNKVVTVNQPDELILKSNEGIHLIGVRCPPVQDKQVGEKAAEYVRSCILDKYIELEQGEVQPKVNEWIMGYVFFKENDKRVFLNEELLRRGYGKVVLAYPYLKYRSLLEAAEAEAKAKKLGIWSPDYKLGAP